MPSCQYKTLLSGVLLAATHVAGSLGEQKILILTCSFSVFDSNLSLDNLIAESGPKSETGFLLLCCSGRILFVPLLFNHSVLTCKPLPLPLRSEFLFLPRTA